MSKPIIALDFDGVVHSYEKGWQDGKIYGTVVPGFFDWVVEARDVFTLTIYSSRSALGHKGIKPMIDFMSVQLQEWHWAREEAGKTKIKLTLYDFDFPARKPAAFISIDDRAIMFKGDWDAPELKPETLRQFKSWTQTQRGENGTEHQR